MHDRVRSYLSWVLERACTCRWPAAAQSSQPTSATQSWSRPLWVRLPKHTLVKAILCHSRQVDQGDPAMRIALLTTLFIGAGRAFLVKVNANIGNSAVSSSIEEVRPASF